MYRGQGSNEETISDQEVVNDVIHSTQNIVPSHDAPNDSIQNAQDQDHHFSGEKVLVQEITSKSTTHTEIG